VAAWLSETVLRGRGPGANGFESHRRGRIFSKEGASAGPWMCVYGPVAPTPVKVNCRLKCLVTLVTYCYNNVFVYFNLKLNLTHVGATDPMSIKFLTLGN
jgi:hypothetical protein